MAAFIQARLRHLHPQITVVPARRRDSAHSPDDPQIAQLAPFGLCLVVVPHWNNSEGGAELDTRRCFIGLERWEQLQALLP